ncbi:Coagulation factor 5/8 C-terminal domain [Dillenia turbinata]|uniref:alpha-L-fucosidase n=1 Tax=Dillenia turbinata TaxID=194707 RepID=A0AAN8V4X4_9MAGN
MTKERKLPIYKLTVPSTLTTLLILISLTSTSSSQQKTRPPLPILPLPSSRQLSWQLSNMALFLHFGPNTFTGSEWGSGHADPSVFNPTRLNASQWVSVAKEAGFSRVLITAKHHDGFCLWPSEYTNYSVKSSPWRDGNGDVVGELAKSAREFGVQLGIYLSPWDRHEKTFGLTKEYNEYYLGQMTELLTWYGTIKEVFLDGAKGEREKDMEYFFNCWFDVIHQLQPGAAIFSDAGPDIRWIGDEAGVAGSTCWSLFNRSAAKIGGTDPLYLRGGDPRGHDWVPAECDVSIRPGWFWHASEVPKSALTLLDIYYKSVGRNCLLLLNVPPNSSGLISMEDIQVLQGFKELRNSIFSNNLARNALLHASSTRGGDYDSEYDSFNVIHNSIYTYWAPEEDQSDWVIYIDFEEPVTFNVLQVQEPIHLGQRVFQFHLDMLNESEEWKKVIDGTTVGYQRLLQFPSVKSKYLRLVIDKSRADPLISYLGLFMDPFSILRNISDTSLGSNRTSSQVIQRTNNSSLIAAI